MVDRHAAQQMLSAGMTTGEVARHFKVSPRTIRRIRNEVRVEDGDDRAARRTRRVGRPQVKPEVRERMRALTEANPLAPPLEVLRQLREEGIELG